MRTLPGDRLLCRVRNKRADTMPVHSPAKQSSRMNSQLKGWLRPSKLLARAVPAKDGLTRKPSGHEPYATAPAAAIHRVNR
jgi:hypothetical protein